MSSYNSFFVNGVIVLDGCWLAVLVAADASCS